MRVLLALCAVLLLVTAPHARAHKPSDSYLSIRADGNVISGQWDIALRDLEFAIGVDTDHNGEITWGELRARLPEIDAYIFARLQFSADGKACAALPQEHLVDDHSDGAYAVIRFRVDCGRAAYQEAELNYTLFADIDPTHRGLLRVAGRTQTATAVLGPDRQRAALASAPRPLAAQFLDFAREGVWHIWIGFDHILFLLSLLLPAVLVASSATRARADAFAPVLIDVLKVVTAFTVAHSITLSLAALSVVQLPSRFVESAIALSVVLAAINNIRPIVRERRWLVAFSFGLIHGFGFASVLADLGLPQEALLLALVAFNLGVEAGQLAIVCAFLPVAYALRATIFYRRIVLHAGSAAIAAIAAVWLAERALDVRIWP